jgi:hypothetical protein
MRLFDEALSSIQRAIDQSPTDPRFLANYGQTCLCAGDFEQGWRLYEYRRQCLPAYYDDFIAVLKRDHSLPIDCVRWDGSDIPRHLLVVMEQGLGDCFFAARYFKRLDTLNIPYVFVIGKEGESVRSMMEQSGILVASLQDVSMFTNATHYIELMSLHFILKCGSETGADTIPYLTYDPNDCRIKKDIISHYVKSHHRLKIGLTWTGLSRPDHNVFHIDQRRSASFDSIAAGCADHPDCLFFSFQVGVNALAHCKEAHSIIDLAPYIHDFKDTASFLSQMDLLITVDTSIANLAGALGVQTWLLNRYDSCWRWHSFSDKSPLFPTVRVFNPSEPKSRESVAHAVFQALHVYP